MHAECSTHECACARLIWQEEKATAVDGVAFNLWNNAWSTNYLFFYPWHSRDADIEYGFELTWD